MTAAERDAERIAELRRVAREALGRAEERVEKLRGPTARWRSGTGELQRWTYGPGKQVLSIDAAARRLRIPVDQLRERAQVFEIGGWGFYVVELAEVERLEAAAAR